MQTLLHIPEYIFRRLKVYPRANLFQLPKLWNIFCIGLLCKLICMATNAPTYVRLAGYGETGPHYGRIISFAQF